MAVFGDELKKMAARDDEKTEVCIHCGKTWYSMHYKDGVCHSCQEKWLKGRNEIKLDLLIKKLIILTVVVLILLSILGISLTFITQ